MLSLAPATLAASLPVVEGLGSLGGSAGVLALRWTAAAAAGAFGVTWLLTRGLLAWRGDVEGSGARERALARWPARLAWTTLLFALPLAWGLSGMSVAGHGPPAPRGLAVLGIVGAAVGLVLAGPSTLGRLVDRKPTWRECAGYAALVAFRRYSTVAAIAVALVAPLTWTPYALLLPLLVLGIWVAVGSALPALLRIAGLASAPPARLARAVERAAAEAGVGPVRAALWHMAAPQAVMAHGSRTVLVSPWALELLDDEQLAAAVHHELAHLLQGSPGLRAPGLRFVLALASPLLVPLSAPLPPTVRVFVVLVGWSSSLGCGPGLRRPAPGRRTRTLAPRSTSLRRRWPRRPGPWARRTSSLPSSVRVRRTPGRPSTSIRRASRSSAGARRSR